MVPWRVGGAQARVLPKSLEVPKSSETRSTSSTRPTTTTSYRPRASHNTSNSATYTARAYKSVCTRLRLSLDTGDSVTLLTSTTYLLSPWETGVADHATQAQEKARRGRWRVRADLMNPV